MVKKGQKIRAVKNQTFLVQLLFCIIYFGSSIVLLGSIYRPISFGLILLRYILVSLGFFSLLVIFLKKKKVYLVRFPTYLSFYLLLTWFFFSIFIIISEVAHSTLPVKGLFFFIMIPMIYFLVMPSVIKRKEQTVLWGLFIANFIFVVFSFATVPFQTIPYTGVAANSNGFAQIGTLSFISAFYLYFAERKMDGIKGYLLRLILIVALIISFAGVVLTTSRTSIMVVLIIYFVIIVYFAVVQSRWLPLLLSGGMFLLVFMTPLKERIFSGVLEKAQQLSSQGNLLNGRFVVWNRILHEGKALGNGGNYFDGVMEGAHNSIIYILGVYGYIPAFLLSIFLVLALIISFRYAIVYRLTNNYGLLPFVLILTFFLYSLTESMFGLIGNALTISFFNVIGFLFYRKNRLEDCQNEVKKVQVT